MITEIGIVAGEIWNFLDKNGEVTLTEIIDGIDRSQDIVLMSMGWLAREGHVRVNKHEGNYRVNLRTPSEVIT
ncbi:MAG: winged helix-turn-helix domain-containing protein [Candidatus Omnitrophota bacterium]